MIAASVTKIPELNLDPTEAAKLAASIANVAEQYDIAVARRTLAWMDLSVTVGGIYGTRAYAYHLRKQAEGVKKMGPGSSGPVAVPKQPGAALGTGA
jgi:hypothetical protein